MRSGVLPSLVIITPEPHHAVAFPPSFPPRAASAAPPAEGESEAPAAADRLETYRAKRTAGRHSRAVRRRARPARRRSFVVQKHAARRMHYDLRLELDGVLLSWAVPQGPSLDPGDKRLAVRTEDHPLEYPDFEGVIPEGNYGAGAMIVWDRGTWVPLEPMAEGLEKGKLLFELRGYKLRGAWTLFRTSGRSRSARTRPGARRRTRPRRAKTGPDEWLLIKKPDGFARKPGDEPLPEESILSGLTVEELAGGGGRAGEIEARLERVESAAAPRRSGGPAADARRPRPTSRSRHRDWLFELKYDGFRLMAAKEGGRVRLFYRRGTDVTHLFPDLARAVAALPYPSFLLDGEVVVLDDGARPSFQRLQKRTQLVRKLDIQRAAIRYPATYFAFDLLSFGDFDLRALPLVERKRELAAILPPAGPLRYADHVVERGDDFYGAVAAMKLEGMRGQARRLRLPPGRSPHWLKIRADRRDDFVIVGMSPPQGARHGFGALHLGAFRVDASGQRELVYAGRVGTGFSDALLEKLHAQLLASRRDDPPVDGPIPPGGGWPGTRRRRTRRRVGRARAGVRGALQGVDRGGSAAPAGVPAAAAGQDDRGVPAAGEREAALERAEAGEIARPRERRERRTPSAERRAHDAAAASGSRRAAGAAAVTLGSAAAQAHQSRQGVLARGGLHQGRPHRLLPRGLAGLLPYLRDRPLVLTRYPDGIAAARPSVLPEERAEPCARLDPDRDHLERVVGARDRVLRGARARRAALHGQPRRDPAPRVVEPPRHHRAPRLVHPRPRPQGGAVSRRRHHRARAARPVRGDRDAELRQDQRLERPPRAAAARAAR